MRYRVASPLSAPLTRVRGGWCPWGRGWARGGGLLVLLGGKDTGPGLLMFIYLLLCKLSTNI